MAAHHHHDDESGHERGPGPDVRILAIDVGAGTQDILLWDSTRTPENCFKLVLPSQTQIVGARIRSATSRRSALHLGGVLMGGGASSSAIQEHLSAGLPVTANASAARTLHNDLNRVQAMGVSIREEAPPGAETVVLGDVDLPAIASSLESFGVPMPDTVAVAIQDHGYDPGRGNNAVRFDYLQSLIENGGDLAQTVFTAPPAGMTRMEAVAAAIPGVYLMDTGAAAVLGAMGDPKVAAAVASTGAILVNVGNMHTFATLVRGRRLFGLFELHTGGITPEIVSDLVERLREGTIDGATFTRDFDGHGAALDPAYRDEGPFPFVAVTGPNRGRIQELGYHQAAPHGDMMLAGSFGLVDGVYLARAEAGTDTRPLQRLPGR